MNKPIVMLGSGGHAQVVMSVLKEINLNIDTIVTQVKPINFPESNKYRWLFSDNELFDLFLPDQAVLVNGVGSMPGNDFSCKLFKKFRDLGYDFMTVVSPRAFVGENVQLLMGAQVMAGVIIQTGSVIGENTILNTGAIVDHGCDIGSHNHIAPGATLCGCVRTEQRVHIGTGANVIQNISVGSLSVIGAGATIVRNVGKGTTVVPAKNCII